MNIRSVLRTYSLLRQLTDDETALLKTLQSLNDSERELLVESLSPQKSTTKKKAATKTATKSARASSLQRQIQSTTRTTKDSTQSERCGFVLIDGSPCDQRPDDNVHHLTNWMYYHPFELSSGVRIATGKSSSKNATPDTSVASSGIGEVAAGAVAGGSSE